MVEISTMSLQLTKEAYLSLAERFLKQGKSLYEAYQSVEDITSSKGYASRYSSFDSFKNAHLRKNRRR